MPFQFSKETTDLVNQTMQDVTQHIAEGTSNLPSNVQGKIIENTLYKYYQEQQAAQKRAARNAVSEAKSFAQEAAASLPTPKITFNTGQQFEDAVSSGIKSSVASNVDAQRALYEAGQSGREAQMQEDLKDLEERLAEARRAYGQLREQVDLGNKDFTERDVQDKADQIKQLEVQISAYKKAPEAQRGATEETSKLADEVKKSAEEDIKRAQKGRGKIGAFLLDATAGGVQLLGDIGAGALAGGGTMPALAMRSFGGGTQQARQAGASLGQQIGFGAASAAVEVLTEKMADGLAGAFGKGAADDVAEEVIRRLSSSPAGQTVLRTLYGMGGEGIEEVVSELVSPAINAIYDKGKSAKESYGTKEGRKALAADALYSGLLGATLGAPGSAVNIATGRDAQANARNQELSDIYKNTGTPSIGQAVKDRGILENIKNGKNYDNLSIEEQASEAMEALRGRTPESVRAGQLSQAQNKLWEMRKDSVLGKQNAEGQREGGKKNASNDELRSMFDRAMKRGDISTMQTILEEMERREAAPQEADTSDPDSTNKLARRMLDQLAGLNQKQEQEHPVPGNSQPTAQQTSLPDEFKDLNPIAAQQFSTYEGGDLETVIRSLTRQEVYRYEQYLRYIGQYEKADLIERIRLDPTYRYEEKAPHPADDPNLRNGPQNAAGQQEAPAGQITQPSQQNAAQTVKPGDSATTENSLLNVVQNPNGVSTRSTESGTMSVPNTQEVITNAGEQAVQQPEEAGTEVADFGVGRRPAGAGAAAGQRGVAGQQEAALEGTERRSQQTNKALPRFVSREDVNELPDVEESAPITQEQRDEYSSLIPLTNNGIQVVSKPQIGSRLHLAWSLAKKLGQKVLFARNYNGSVFKDGSTAYQSKGNVIVDADNTQMELATAVAHEAGHDKYFKKFGGYADIVNGAYTKRLNFFTGVFNDALGMMKGLQTMRTVEKYIRNNKGYGKRYDRSRARYTREVNAKITNPLTQNATNLVAEMEKARSIEEFMNQLLALDRYFLDAVEAEAGISWDDLNKLRDSLISALKDQGIFTSEEIAAIDDSIDALEEGGFTDDLSDEEETSSPEVVDADAEAANFKGDLGRAVRKAAAGETSSMADNELLAVLDYALDRAVPSSKGGTIAARLSELYDEYVKSATSYIPEFGYRGRRIGTLSEGSAKSLMRTVSTAIGELSDRGIKFSSPDDSITDFANMFGAIADKNGNPVDIAYSEKKEDTRKYDDGKGILETEDEWNRKNAPRIKRDMERGNDVVESFNSYQENGTRRRDIPTSPAKTTQKYQGKDIEDTGWIKPVEVSEKEIKRARDAVEAKGKEAELKDRIKTLEAQKKYLEAVATGMREARSGLYANGDIEQRKSDLGYLADNIKEQMDQLNADIGYMSDELDDVLAEDPNSPRAVTLLNALDNAQNTANTLNVQLEALRDEYRHIEADDSASLRNVRSQIDSVISEISALSRQLDSVSKRAEKADWGSNKRTLFQAEMAENPLSETEESKARPPISEPGYNERVHELSYEERAEERLRRAKDAAKKEAERRKSADFGRELRKRTDEYAIVRNETDRSMNDKSNVPGYALNPEAPTRTGIEPTTTSEKVRSITRARAEQIKQEEQLNKSFSKAIRRVTSKDLKGFNIAREMRQGMEDRYETDVDAEAADFGPSRSSTAYTNIEAAVNSVLNSKSLFFAQDEGKVEELSRGGNNTVFRAPEGVMESMGDVRRDMYKLLHGDTPVDSLMHLTELYTNFQSEDSDMFVFTSEEINDAVKDIQDIANRKITNNEVKAAQLADASLRFISLASKRIQNVDKSMRILSTFQRSQAVKRGNNGAVRQAWDSLKAFQLNPATMFKMMDNFDREGKGYGYQIARQIDNGTAKYQTLYSEAMYAFLGLNSMEGFADFADGKSTSSVKLFGNTLTEQQAVEFIKQVRNLQATPVKGGGNRLGNISGFTLRDKAGNEITISAKDSDGARRNFVEIANQMEAALSPVAKAYLDTATEVLNKLGKETNDVMKKSLGVGFANSEAGVYYPISYRSPNGQQEYGDRGPGYNRFTNRVRQNGGYVLVQNASQTIDRYIDQACDYAAYGELANMLGIMNAPGMGMRSLTNIAGDAFGKTTAKVFDNYVKDINGEIRPGANDPANKALRSARLAMQTGTLALSASVPIKQVASYWDAAGVISLDALRKAYRFKGPFVKAKGGAAENNLLKYRGLGGIDPTISEAMNDSKFIKEIRKRSKVVNALSKATSVMDMKTVDNLFTAAVIDVEMSMPGVDHNDELFKKAVEAKFQAAVLQTQPIFTKNARAEYQRTDNELVKVAGMFRTQQTQNFNQLITAIGEAAATKGTSASSAYGKQLRRTIAGQLSGALEFGLLSIAADFILHSKKKYRDDDEELSAKKIAERLLMNTIESAAGTVWFGDSAVKWLIEKITGENEFYGISLGPLSTVKQAYDAIDTFAEKPNLSNGRYALGYIAQAFGVPMNNAYRILNSAAMYVADIIYTATDGKEGNRANYDDAMKMLDSYIKGKLTEDGAKTQAARAFRKGQPENLLYNLGILSSLTEEGGQDKGRNYLDSLIKKSGDSDAEESKNHRIVDYLVHQAVSADKIDKAVDQYGASNQYNQFYEILRQNGHSPVQAVKKLDEIDTNGDSKITTDELQDYWKKHGHEPKENKLIEALFGPTADDFRIIKDTKTFESSTRYYKPVIDSGVTAERAVEIVDGCRSESGDVTQAGIYQYYLAHPEDIKQIQALYNSMGYKEKGQPRTWESFLKAQAKKAS